MHREVQDLLGLVEQSTCVFEFQSHRFLSNMLHNITTSNNFLHYSKSDEKNKRYI